MQYRIEEYLEPKRDRGRIQDYTINSDGKQLAAEIIAREDLTDRLVDFSEAFGRFLAHPREGITTSQIRNIFGEVKKIEMEWDRGPETSWVRLQLLRPKLAYTAKKADRPGSYALREMLSEAIQNVQGKKENFRRFVNFFEAILAYHKAAGGR